MTAKYLSTIELRLLKNWSLRSNALSGSSMNQWKVETQMKSFRRSIESLLNEHTTHLSKIPASVSTSPVVPESAEQIAVSLLSEQKEKEK